MTSAREIPWPRIFAEGAAIVVSILLAFWIEAWWEDQQNRESEKMALQSLQDDFEASRKEIADRIGSLESARVQFHEFQSSNLEDLERLPQSAAEQMLSNLGTGGTFDPFLGTLEAIAADGRLALVRNDDIRGLLSKWSKAVADLEEDSQSVRSSAIRLRSKMEVHGGPFFSSFIGQSGPLASEIFPRADGSIVAQLRQDDSFVGAARSHQYTISVYLLELNVAAELLSEIVRELGQNAQ